MIVADDTKAEGLARPWIPYTCAMVNEPTDSTGWSTLYQRRGFAQNPRMRANLAPIPAGTPGGQVRLIVDEQVIATVTAPTAINTTFDVPDYRYNRAVSYRIEAPPRRLRQPRIRPPLLPVRRRIRRHCHAPERHPRFER
ncbi:hypothetical protein [Streptomyces sp. N35]|uniref:hypothetical protein n=1 Tax=Streptomyces sp. N35 TaxID=2795730 RepID=UPI0018F38ECA|nr:hypothetical protein [Streptomyces sp. N35]